MKKAITLISGGLDSTTVLAYAINQGYECHALSFHYGQKQSAELVAAKDNATRLGAKSHRLIELPIGHVGGSALTDPDIDVPDYVDSEEIPVTYVPARNTIFLSFGMAWAEVLKAEAIFFGASNIDYSGYPDCRPEYIDAFQTMANLATKSGVEGETLRIEAPLLHLSKAETIELGIKLGIDYATTISCYAADDEGLACGRCDSCVLRAKGFREAGIEDPTHYRDKISL